METILTNDPLQIRDSEDDDSNNSEDLMSDDIQIEQQNISSEFLEMNKLDLPVGEMVCRLQKVFKYECAYCKTIFSKSILLSSHVHEIHQESVINSSKICGEEQQKVNEIMCGKVLMAEVYRLFVKCTMCQKELDGTKQFRQHITENHILRDNVRKKNGKRNEIFSDIQSNIKNTSQKCSSCKKEFQNNLELDEHNCSYTIEEKILPVKSAEENNRLNENENNEACMCLHCYKIFKSKYQLKKHEAMHIKPARDNLKVCQYCQKTFLRPSERKRHELTHTGEKPFKCDICSTAFRERGKVYQHMRRVHNIEPLTKT